MPKPPPVSHYAAERTRTGPGLRAPRRGQLLKQARRLTFVRGDRIAKRPWRTKWAFGPLQPSTVHRAPRPGTVGSVARPLRRLRSSLLIGCRNEKRRPAREPHKGAERAEMPPSPPRP